MSSREANTDAAAFALMRRLSSLPPEINKYIEAAAFLEAEILPKPAQTPLWLTQVTLAFAILYACLFILAIGVLVALAAVAEGGLWFFRIRNDGVWLLHTRAWYVCLSIAFCVANCVTLAWQVLQEYSRANYKHWILLEGLKWIPLYVSAQIFCHGIAVARSDTGSTEILVGGASVEERAHWLRRLKRRRALKTGLNASLLILPTAVTLTEAVVFLMANSAYNELYDMTVHIANTIKAEAAGYDSSASSFIRLLQLLQPAQALSGPAARFLKLTHLGWILWAAFSVFLSLIFAPFLWHHLRLLRDLIGAPSLLSAFTCGCRDDGGLTGSSAAHMTAKRAHLHPDGSIRTSRIQCTVPVRWSANLSAQASSSVTTDAPSGSEGRTGGVRSTANRQGYVSLCWAALAAYAVLVGYIPLAIWAACATVQDAALWYASVFWGSGLYCICGLVLHGCFLRRVISSSPRHASQGGAASGMEIGRISSFKRAASAHRKSLSRSGRGVYDHVRGVMTTPGADDTPLPAIWIQTHTEVHHEIECDGYWRSTSSPVPTEKVGGRTSVASSRFGDDVEGGQATELPMKPLRALRKCGSWPAGSMRHDRS